MSALNHLIAVAGQWHGTNTLQDPMTNRPETSAATATLTPLLGERFVRFDYTWEYQGNGQAGSLLIGYESEAAVVTAYWIDSWHMNDKGMLCRGTVDEQGIYSVRGSYTVPDWPDWGWRILLDPTADETLRMVMYNIDPDGKEYLAVEANYQRI